MNEPDYWEFSNLGRLKQFFQMFFKQGLDLDKAFHSEFLIGGLDCGDGTGEHTYKIVISESGCKIQRMVQ